MKALTGLVPEWFRPEGLEEGDIAEFEVSPIAQRQVAEVQNHYDMESGQMRPTGYYTAYEIGCTNWRGVTDDEGKDFPFSIRNLSKIPIKIAMEIGAQVINVSSLTEDDRKNLSSR